MQCKVMRLQLPDKENIYEKLNNNNSSFVLATSSNVLQMPLLFFVTLKLKLEFSSKTGDIFWTLLAVLYYIVHEISSENNKIESKRAQQ